MTALPKFNFKAVELDDVTLGKMIDDSEPKEQGKHFRPGNYQSEITSSKYLGQASDETWAKWVVKYQGAGDKETSDMIFVPSTKLTYLTSKGKEDTFAIAKLKNFVEALGGEFTVGTLADTLSVYFGKEDALVGQHIGLQMGYPGTHVTYLGKSEEGGKRLGLAFRSGDAVPNTPEFADYDAAHAYCADKKIDVKRFVEVLKYEKSVTANKKTDSNW